MNAANEIFDPENMTAHWNTDRARLQVFGSRGAIRDTAAVAIARQINIVAQEKGSVRMVFVAAPDQWEALQSLTGSPEILW